MHINSPLSVSAEETGVDLGQKKDSYFYSCCHNNWCWATGREAEGVTFSWLEWNLEMLDGRQKTLELGSKTKKSNWTVFTLLDLFLLCHKELTAACLHRGASTSAVTNTYTSQPVMPRVLSSDQLVHFPLQKQQIPKAAEWNSEALCGDELRCWGTSMSWSYCTQTGRENLIKALYWFSSWRVDALFTTVCFCLPQTLFILLWKLVCLSCTSIWTQTQWGHQNNPLFQKHT